MKRFIHLSDLHFSHKGKTQNEIYFETRQTILDVLIKIKKLKPEPDFILVSGDLTNTGDIKSYQVLRDIFNQINIPIGLVLLFLMGIGPLLSWNYTSKSVLLSRFKTPMISSFFTGLMYIIFSGLFQLYVFVAIMGVAFTLTSILGEFYKSYKKQKRSSNFFKSLLEMFLSNRHKNGGYIVHIGIVLLFIGFIGRAFEVEKEFSLSPGEQIYFSNYIFKLNSINSEARDNHYAFLSDIDVIDNNNELLTYDAKKNIGYFKIMINPLVNWVWIGGILMVIGSLFAFWPSRRVT